MNDAMANPWPGKKIMVLAGGTGGHVYPALAVAEALRTAGAEISWLGNANGFEGRRVPAAGFPLTDIGVEGLRGRSKWRAPLMLLKALWRSFRALRAQRPDMLLAFGGFTGLAGVWAKRFAIPLALHEQNARMGLTNRELAKRWASLVLLGDLQALAVALELNPNSHHTGNPVRADIAALPAPAQRFANRRGPIRLLVLGGSQGAQALNELLPAALARLPEALRPRVRHQVGPAHVAATAALYAAAGLTADIVPFIDDMPGAYAEADWVIARAGASTVAELATVGLGAVLVPYPHAVDDHQYYNALTLAGSGGAEVARQENLSPERLALMISARSDRAVLLQHAEAVRTLSHADALGRITAALATLLQE